MQKYEIISALKLKMQIAFLLVLIACVIAACVPVPAQKVVASPKADSFCDVVYSECRQNHKLLLREGKLTEIVHFREVIRIQTAAGAISLRLYPIEMELGMTIESFKAFRLATDGKWQKLRIKQSTKISSDFAQGKQDYYVTDSRIMAYVIPDLEPGETVAFEYCLRRRESAFIGQVSLWRPGQVEKSEIKIQPVPGYGIECCVIDTMGCSIQIMDSADCAMVEIVTPKKRSLKKPTLFFRMVAKVQNAPQPFFRNWIEAGNWCCERIHPQEIEGHSVDSLLHALWRQDTLDQVRTSYEWVRDHIRYLAMFSGLGGWKAHTPEFVLQKGYGDCKDMSVLLSKLLNKRGIRAYPALVSVRGQTPTPVCFATVSTFNHCIVKVETAGHMLWLDPTAKSCPFGKIPPHIEGISALVLSPRPVLETIPVSPPCENREEYKIQYRFRNSVIEATVSATFVGLAGQNARSLLYSQTRDELARKLCLSLSSNAQIDTVHVMNEAELGKPLQLFLRCHFPAPLFEDPPYRILSLLNLKHNYLREPLMGEALHSHKGQAGFSLVFEFPGSFEFPDMPPFQIEQDSLELKFYCSRSGHKLLIQYEFENRRLDTDYASGFSLLHSKIEDIRKKAIVLLKREALK